MGAKSGKLRSLPTLLFLWAVVLTSSNSRVFVSAQFEESSLNFCDIPCVQKVYDQYCGRSRCTTGASDYGQIFALCTETCAAAVIGEVMMLCLTTTVPDRDDWANVQHGVLEEIVSFCSGYEIAVDENVKPLKRKDTDKKLRNTLFDTPEDEKKESNEGKGKSGRKEEKGGKRSRKAKLVEAEESKSQKQRKRQKAAAESDVDTSKERSRESKKDTEGSEKSLTRASPTEEAVDETVIRTEIALNTEILGSSGSPEKDEIEEAFDGAFDADSSK